MSEETVFEEHVCDGHVAEDRDVRDLQQACLLDDGSGDLDLEGIA